MLGTRVFSMVFPPKKDLRIDEVLYFLETMRHAFKVSKWLDCEDEVVRLSTTDVNYYLGEKWKKKPPSVGGRMLLAPHGGNYPLEISVATGSDGHIWDGMSVGFRDSDPVPDLRHFRHCIDTCRPSVAEIAHHDNEFQLDTWARAKAFKKKRCPKCPVIINWFHYWDRQMAESLGGLKHCLQTPAYKTEPFADGVLLQLTEEPLEPDNEEHLLAQRRAMEHLGMPWEFTPEPSKSSFFPKKQS